MRRPVLGKPHPGVLVVGRGDEDGVRVIIWIELEV